MYPDSGRLVLSSPTTVVQSIIGSPNFLYRTLPASTLHYWLRDRSLVCRCSTGLFSRDDCIYRILPRCCSCWWLCWPVTTTFSTFSILSRVWRCLRWNVSIFVFLGNNQNSSRLRYFLLLKTESYSNPCLTFTCDSLFQHLDLRAIPRAHFGLFATVSSPFSSSA